MSIEQETIQIEEAVIKAEVPFEQEPFSPATYLTEQLIEQGMDAQTARAWMKGLDPRAETAENVKDRIFFVNRALRLYMSEQFNGSDGVSGTMNARLLVTDGIEEDAWKLLIKNGVASWLAGKPLSYKTEEPEQELEGEEPSTDTDVTISE